MPTRHSRSIRLRTGKVLRLLARGGRTEWSRPIQHPDRVCQQMLRHTEPGVHETGMLQVLVLTRIRGRRWRTAQCHTAMAGAHLRHAGM